MKLTQEAKIVVKAAIDIISDPGKWTQGKSAEDKDKNECYIMSPVACRWRAIVAIEKAIKENVPFDKQDEVRQNIINVFEIGYNRYENDCHGRESVINKLNLLIVENLE